MLPMTRRVRRLRPAGLLLTLLLAGWQFSGAAWIHAKANLAQHLLARAWGHSQSSGAVHKPWPWADTWPVARLQVPALSADYHVLSGMSGQALAFGPALHPVLNGEGGQWAVLAGHRDTHFRFLQSIEQGMSVQLEDLAGAVRSFEVVSVRVVDSRVEMLHPPTVGSPGLLLVTCYPFDHWQPNGPLRYVVEAVPNRAGRQSVPQATDG